MKKLFLLIPAMLLTLANYATETPVAPGTNAIRDAVAAASANDVLVLSTGTYTEDGGFEINKNLTIRAAVGQHPEIAQKYAFLIVNGSQVTFKGIKFDGGLYPVWETTKHASDHCLRSHNASTGEETLTVEDCDFTNYPNYIIYAQRGNRRMDAITIRNCYFYNNERSAVYVGYDSSESTDLACNSVTIENSTFANFTNVKEALISVKNSGTVLADQVVRIDHCTFYNFVKNNESNYTFIDVRKSTDVEISNCIFAQPSAGMSGATYCYGGTISNCLIYNTNGHRSGSCVVTNGITADPLFTDAANGDFSFPGDYVNDNVSPARGTATDGTDLGDPRWYTPATYPTTDFSGAGYVFTAAKAKLTAGTTILETNESAPTHPYIRYTHASPTGNSEWVIQATKACYVQATVNMVDNMWTTDPNDPNMFDNHKHVFVVEVRNANNALVGSVKEGDYNEDGTTDGWDTYPTVNLKGSIYIPEAGVYSVILKNYRNYSRCGVGSVTLAYAGGDTQTITNTADFVTDIDDAYFSSNGTRADGKISFSGNAVASEWVRWNVTVANSDYYDITLNSAVESGHIYSVTFYDGETQVARVAESAWHNTTGALALGRRFLPAGDYVMEIKNSVSSNSDAKIVSVGAVAFVAPVIALPNTFPAASTITSELAYEDGGELYFTPSDQRGHILEQWAKWKVSVAEAGAFLFTMNVTSTNEQSYKITILDSENNELDFFEKNPSSGARTIQHYFNLAAGNYFVMVQNTTNHSAGQIVSMVVSQPAGIVTIDEATTSTDSWADKVGETTYDVQIIRTIKAGMYNTLCLPFAVSSSQCKDIFGADVQIRTLESSTIEEGDFVLNLNFKVASDIYPGTPILIQTSRDIVNPVFTGVKFTAAAPATSTTARVNFIGNFAKGTIPPGENNLFMGANNTLYFPTVETEILGMRGYFYVHDAPAGVIQRAQIVEADAPAITTEINCVEVNASVKTIENGQLVIIRDGKKYNVMGVRMK